MKHFYFICFLSLSICSFGQNVQVDSQTYTPQQLIEDVLINSNCITNVVVTNVVGGNFNGTDQSYGFFDASGTTFPFQNGIVLSTGKLANVEGPNNTLSDDNATNWVGDNDLENILNENNTINATIIEFEFTAIASQISFRYLFASEEYQEGNANTCQYSDLFGFLIRNVNDVQYTNIALIPNTQTPVKVTTVHPEIPNGCAAQNEAYFGSWNNATAPINFNGQTAVLTATANTTPNETYHVKLVIADEQNYRYDSAVFLEAGSFQLSTDLGEDRLFATNNPLCEGEALQLDAYQPGNNSYKWFKNGTEILGETNSTYTVTDAGTYNVEVTLQNSCIAYGDIKIEYAGSLNTNPNSLGLCDNDHDGITFFDLHLADPFYSINSPILTVVDFYLTEDDATQNINPIPNPNSFINTVPNQIVFARLENEYGCFAVEPLTLIAVYTSSNITSFEACDNDGDGFTTFDLNELRAQIEPEVSQGAEITFYSTYDDAANHINQLSDSYINTTAFSQDIYVKAQVIFCELFTTINLVVNNEAELLDNETVSYCLNSYPETITIDSGLLNSSGNNPTYQWFFNNVALSQNTSSININETGTYTVVVTFSNGCSSSRDITVNPSNIATIESIDIQQASENNTVTVSASGEGNYQYALDNPIFHEDNTFTNVKPGFHTVYVLDTNGCGTVEQEISVLGFPKFLTPNNDGVNDTWKPYGVNEQFNADIDIKIFDRYGKFIKQINPLEVGWNGTFNGNLLSSDDYWYVVILADGTEYRGHFSLKR